MKQLAGYAGFSQFGAICQAAILVHIFFLAHSHHGTRSALYMAFRAPSMAVRRRALSRTCAAAAAEVQIICKKEQLENPRVTDLHHGESLIFPRNR